MKENEHDVGNKTSSIDISIYARNNGMKLSCSSPKEF